jgi:FkbM family methyltransferase
MGTAGNEHAAKQGAAQRLGPWDQVKHFLWVNAKGREAKNYLAQLVFRDRTVEHTYGDQVLKVHLTDRIAWKWYDRDMPVLDEIGFLRTKGLRHWNLAFNLGAHQSVIAMMLAHEVGPDGKVVAVEGALHNWTCGSKNLALNNVRNVELIHAVVGRQDGGIAFWQGLNGSVAANKKATTVRSVTVDTLVAQYGEADLIFMDIEGYELEALGGATRTLERADAVWVIEVHGDETLQKYGGRNADVVGHFAATHTLYFRDGEERPFVELTSTDDTPSVRFHLIAIPKSRSV